MKFKTWLENRDRAEDLIQSLVDHDFPIDDLADNIFSESLTTWLKDKFSRLKDGVNKFRDGMKDDTEEWKSYGKKIASFFSRKKPEYSIPPSKFSPKPNDLNDELRKLVNEIEDYSNLEKYCRKGHDGKIWCVNHWDFNKTSDVNPGNPFHDGYIEEEKYLKKIENMEKELEFIKNKSKNSSQRFVGNLNKTKYQGKEAIKILRSVLSDPKNQEILNHLEKELSNLNAPDYYKNMTVGEKNWYNRLSDEEKSHFNAEMGKSGNRHLHHGDEWWNVASTRANKASQQGYRDTEANWKWAADFANRQRIRKELNPSWEKELQWENTKN